MRLYGDPISGNVYKVQLLCALLGRDYELDPVEIWTGVKTADFTRINPNQRVPAIDDDGFVLWESNAILCYLADGTPWLSDDRRLRALVLQWLFFEQYSHEPYLAVRRALLYWRPPSPERDALVAAKLEGCLHALRVMDGHLAKHDWFVGDGPTVADLALYPFTSVAGEGELDMAPYPHVARWLRRVEALPGFSAMPPYPQPGPYATT